MMRHISRRGAFAAFFAVALVLFATPLRADPDVISAVEANAQAARGELMIIDVRSEAEWRETGVPKGAETVTIHNRNGLPGFLAELKKVVGDETDARIAFICASGVRSSAAQRLSRGAGYANVMNIREGMLGNSEDGPGWIARDLPTQPCPDC